MATEIVPFCLSVLESCVNHIGFMRPETGHWVITELVLMISMCRFISLPYELLVSLPASRDERCKEHLILKSWISGRLMCVLALSC